MKNIWKVGVLALAMAFTFSSCGDDTTDSPAPTNTTDEVVGTYTGLFNFTVKTGTLTGGFIPDSTESETVNVVVTKSTGGFTLSVDDNDPSTPADPAQVNVNEVTLASNGTSMQLPSQSFEIDSAEFITIVGLKSFANGTTPVAGLYTRADKKLRLKASSTIPFPINDSTEIPVPVEFEFNVTKK